MITTEEIAQIKETIKEPIRDMEKIARANRDKSFGTCYEKYDMQLTTIHRILTRIDKTEI